MKRLLICILTVMMTAAFAMPCAAFAGEQAVEFESSDVVGGGIEDIAVPEVMGEDAEQEPEVTEPELPEPPKVFEAPTVVTEHNGDAIRISWNEVYKAKKYRVYRSYSLKGKKTRIKETKELYYNDRKNTSGKKAYYFVKAYNGKKWTKYSEAVSDKMIRVYIETGHGIDSKGKWDPGCQWTNNGVTYQEAKLMIPIAQSMTRYMEESGVYVYTDAFTGNDTNLYWMLNFLKSKKVSALINIHCDYYKAKSGTLPLYRTSAQKKLCVALNKGVHSEVDIPHREYQKRTDLLTLKSSKVGAPAVIFETGSIKADNELLRTEYDAYGKGLAKGLCDYLGIPFAAE